MCFFLTTQNRQSVEEWSKCLTPQIWIHDNMYCTTEDGVFTPKQVVRHPTTKYFGTVCRGIYHLLL